MRACYSKTEEELKAVDFSDDATPVNEAMERDVVQHLISYVKERLNVACQLLWSAHHVINSICKGLCP